MHVIYKPILMKSPDKMLVTIVRLIAIRRCFFIIRDSNLSGVSIVITALLILAGVMALATPPATA